MSYAAADRRIRKLSLTVSDPLHARGAVGLIEEALRLASLPGESEGRRYHFRRVILGKMRPRESASLISLRLQSEFMRLASGAVQLDDPRGPQSDAIYFRSPLEPLRFALGRLARGLPVDTWFLCSAVPGLRQALSRGDAVRHLLELSAELPGGVVNTAFVLDEMLAHGELGLLLPLLDEEAVAGLMACFFQSTRAAVPVRSVAVASAWVVTIREALKLWGSADVRTLWLASTALLAEVPARVSDPDLPAKARALVAGVAPAQTAPAALDEYESSEQSNQEIAAGPDGPQQPRHGQLLRLQDSSAQSSKHAALASSQPSSTAQAAAELNPAPFSPYAGFYFLLHVLQHLGIEEFLRDHPALLDVNFPRVLLRKLAQHAGVDEEDPHFSFAPAVSAEVPQDEFPVKMPVRWKEIFGQRRVDQTIALNVTSLARLWVVAVHRWLWRYGELRISRVVRKRGQVRYSRPQVDVSLLLQEVDVRIRRLGLDLDPGWVAWLGLIVRFHYEHRLGDTDGA